MAHQTPALCADTGAGTVSRGAALVGKILDKRYVVLEEVGQDGPGFRYLVYDMNTLQRLHLRVEPEPDGQLTGDTYQVVDMEAPLAPAAGPSEAKEAEGKPDIHLVSKTEGSRPRKPTPRGFATSKLQPKSPPGAEEPGTVRTPRADVGAATPGSPETPSTDNETELEESPLEAAIERALDAENTGGKDPFNTTQPIDLASAEEIAEEPPPDTSRSSGERPRIQTKVLEAAWFAQGDQLEEDEAPPAEEADDRQVDHNELERQAAQLSADEYRKYALDLPPPSPPPLKIVEAFLDAKPDLAKLIGDPDPAVDPPVPAPPAAETPAAEGPVASPPPRSLSPAVGSPVTTTTPSAAALAPDPPPLAPPPVEVPAPAPEPEPEPATTAPEPPPPVEPQPRTPDGLPPLSALLPNLTPLAAPAAKPAPEPPSEPTALEPPPAPPALEPDPPAPAPLPDPTPDPTSAAEPSAPTSLATDPTLLAKPEQLTPPPPVQPVSALVPARPSWAGASARPTSGPAQRLQDLVLGNRAGTFALGFLVGGLLVGVTTCLVMPAPTVSQTMVPVAVRPAEPPAAPPPVAKKAPPPRPPVPKAQPKPPEPPAPPKVHLSSRQRKRMYHYVYMARRSARRHNWKRARYFARKALRIDPSNRRASQIKTRAEQRLGIN